MLVLILLYSAATSKTTDKKNQYYHLMTNARVQGDSKMSHSFYNDTCNGETERAASPSLDL